MSKKDEKMTRQFEQPKDKTTISILLDHNTLTPSEEKEYTLVLDLDETLVHCKDTPDGSVVSFRPFLEVFLDEMVGYYNIVIFTAAAQDYADMVLNDIDPEGKIFSKRLYRQHTKNVNEEYNIKDLLKVNENLEKMIIIDNVPENFMQQKLNGIFINSWFEDQNDTSLRDLIPILKNIVDSKCEDVRVHLTKLREQLIQSIQRGSINPNLL